MSEYCTTHRSALAGRSFVEGREISLIPLAAGHVIQLLGISDRAKVPMPSNVSTTYDAGAGQWYVVGDKLLSCRALEEYFACLPRGAYGVDQSHARVRIGVEGQKAELALAKGTGVDLMLGSFPVGHGTTTLFGHIAVYVARTGPFMFELMVLRSFAESLWDDLVRMSLEFT